MMKASERNAVPCRWRVVTSDHVPTPSFLADSLKNSCKEGSWNLSIIYQCSLEYSGSSCITMTGISHVICSLYFDYLVLSLHLINPYLDSCNNFQVSLHFHFLPIFHIVARTILCEWKVTMYHWTLSRQRQNCLDPKNPSWSFLFQLKSSIPHYTIGIFTLQMETWPQQS